MPFVHVDGVITDVLQHPFIKSSHVQIEKITKRRNKFQGYVIYYHQSGLQVTILGKQSTSNGCVLSAKFCLPQDWARSQENFVGLLGTPDGDPTNDWMDRDANLIPVPTLLTDLRFDKSYDWCVQNWCIRSAGESLFTYDTAESYAGFNHCNLPTDTVTKQCAESPTSELQNVCGSTDLACLVDGCVGGVEEAKDFLTMEAEMTDATCAHEIFFEDFNSINGPGWGEIDQGTNKVHTRPYQRRGGL